MRTRQPNKSLSLEEIRELIHTHKEKGRKIIADLAKLHNHYTKMQEYYSEWEDELNVIQRHIDVAAEEHGIPAKEVEEYDALADVLSDISGE